MSQTEINKLIHDLTIHQVELEVENQELRNVRERLDFAPVAYLSINDDDEIVRANVMAHHMLGVVRGGLLGTRFADHVAPEAVEDFLFHLKQVRRNPAVHSCELEMRREDSAPLFVQIESLQVPEDGKISTALIDITARHRAEVQAAQATVHLTQLSSDLSSQKELLEAIMENTGAMIAYLDRDFEYIKMNSVFERGCGLGRDQILGRNHFEVFAHAGYRAVFEEVRDSGRGVRFEAMSFSFTENTQGKMFWDWSLFPIKNESGRVEGLVLSLMDITERHKARESVQNALSYVESIVNTVRIPLVILDRELRVFSASDVFYREFQMVPASTKTKFFYELRNGEWDFPALRKRLRDVVDYGETVLDFELVSEAPDLGRRFLLLNARRLSSKFADEPQILVDIEDVTERRATQERLIAYERLATLGELSGSIAHEVRNPLATIDSSVFFLKRKLPDADEKVMVHLDRIKSAVDRSGRIVSSLLDLTRMKEPQFAYVDLRNLVGNAASMDGVPEGIETVVHLPDSEVNVRIDPEQVRMALDNVVRNAVEAMDAHGTLIVELCTAKDWAEVRVTDTGQGILPENLEKVFRPLFTTKATGIGFGLSTAKVIMGKHGGTIAMKSQAGGPTTSIIRFPLVRE